MFEIIRKLLPYLLVVFFLYKANKDSIYLLGIPFLKFMGESIFFQNAKPFNIPGEYYYELIFIWLVLLWLIARVVYPNRRKTQVPKSSNVIDICILALGIITLTGLTINLIKYTPVTVGILEEFWLEISLFAGYFIIKDWMASKKPEIIIDFLYSLVIANTVAAVLFLLHQGLHLNVYVTEEYLTESVQGQEITRSFFFMPQFLSFSVIFLLVFQKKYSYRGLAMLVINLLAIVITYTISAVTIAILVIFLYFILNGIKNNNLGLAVRNLVIYALGGIIGLVIMAKLLPANTAYLMARFSDLSKSDYTQKEPNTLEIRFMYTEAVLTKINKYKKIFGVGPVTERQYSGFTEMVQATADMVWVGVIFRWGYVGLALFILIYLFSLFRSFFIFMRSDNNISLLALMVFLYIISQMLDSFVSWTFLSQHGLVTGLWYFAIFSIIIKMFKAREKSKFDAQKEFLFIPTTSPE